MPEYMDAFAWTLLRSSLFVSVGFVCAWCCLRFLKVRSAQIHRLAWMGVLLQGLILTTIDVEWAIDTVADVTHQAAAADDPNGGLFPLDEFLRNVEGGRATYAQLAGSPTISVSQIVIACWFVGVVLTLSWTLFVYIRFLRSLPLPRPLNASWEAQWQRICAANGVRRTIPLHLTANAGPAICWTRSGYRMLIPEEHWSTLTAAQRELVLRHELAHVQRGDLWSELCFRVVASLQWFNPFAWLAVAKLSECAEWACDEIVRRASPGESAEYVRTLLVFTSPRHPIPALVPSATGHSLVRRAQRLLTPQLKEDSGMKKLMITLCVFGLATANGLTVEFVPVQAADESGVASASQDAQKDLTKPPRKRRKKRNADRVPAANEETEKISFNDHAPASLGILGGVTLTPVAGTELQGFGSTREAVIDVKYIFENLPEFQRLRKELQDEVKVQEQRLTTKMQEIHYGVQLNSTPEAEKDGLKDNLSNKVAVLNFAREDSREKLRLREARMYSTVYKKLQAAIAAHAKENGIQIVRRIQSQNESKLDSEDPGTILQAINQQVLYIADDSIDITEPVLQRMMKKPVSAENKRQ